MADLTQIKRNRDTDPNHVKVGNYGVGWYQERNGYLELFTLSKTPMRAEIRAGLRDQGWLLQSSNYYPDDDIGEYWYTFVKKTVQKPEEKDAQV